MQAMRSGSRSLDRDPRAQALALHTMLAGLRSGSVNETQAKKVRAYDFVTKIFNENRRHKNTIKKMRTLLDAWKQDPATDKGWIDWLETTLAELDN